MNKTNQLRPEAYIAVGRNRQKIYSDFKIYLKAGTEFQIELFNPTTNSLGAKIYINDNLISASMLVIRPGQREFLDCYIDSKKKFLFDTYLVENSKEILDAIANNGVVRVEFYKEFIPVAVQPYNNPYNTQPWQLLPYYPVQPASPWPTTQPFYYGTTTDVNCSVATTDVKYTTNTDNINYFSSDGIQGAMGPVGVPGVNGINESLETGRITPGNKSNQKIDYCNITFENILFYSTTYQLLPVSAQPVEVSDIRKYCTGCGNRIRKTTWKFCPGCGEKF
jgi:hypothetical protein